MTYNDAFCRTLIVAVIFAWRHFTKHGYSYRKITKCRAHIFIIVYRNFIVKCIGRKQLNSSYNLFTVGAIYNRPRGNNTVRRHMTSANNGCGSRGGGGRCV